LNPENPLNALMMGNKCCSSLKAKILKIKKLIGERNVFTCACSSPFSQLFDQTFERVVVLGHVAKIKGIFVAYECSQPPVRLIARLKANGKNVLV